MKSKTFMYYVTEFLTTYLDNMRNCSYNTIISYRDTVRLYINFLNSKGIKNSNISFEHFTKENIEKFLDYIQNENGNSISTRNQRLACFKSLCQYIISYEIIYSNQLQPILNIRKKREPKQIINYLSKEEISDLLRKPNVATIQGKKDLLVLSTLYDSAIRVSELLELRVADVILDDIPKLIIRKGKGKKSRIIPISKNLKTLVEEYVKYFNLDGNDYLFISNQRKKYTSNGIRKIIAKYTKDFSFKVTPHTFRHTKATHLVEANVPLIYIRDFLGHESVTTTEIYAKINNNLKNQAILESSIPLDNSTTKNKKYDLENDTDLLNWLNSL